MLFLISVVSFSDQVILIMNINGGCSQITLADLLNLYTTAVEAV